MWFLVRWCRRRARLRRGRRPECGGARRPPGLLVSGAVASGAVASAEVVPGAVVSGSVVSAPRGPRRCRGGRAASRAGARPSGRGPRRRRGRPRPRGPPLRLGLPGRVGLELRREAGLPYPAGQPRRWRVGRRCGGRAPGGSGLGGGRRPVPGPRSRAPARGRRRPARAARPRRFLGARVAARPRRGAPRPGPPRRHGRRAVVDRAAVVGDQHRRAGAARQRCRPRRAPGRGSAGAVRPSGTGGTVRWPRGDGVGPVGRRRARPRLGSRPRSPAAEEVVLVVERSPARPGRAAPPVRPARRGRRAGARVPGRAPAPGRARPACPRRAPVRCRPGRPPIPAPGPSSSRPPAAVSVRIVAGDEDHGGGAAVRRGLQRDPYVLALGEPADDEQAEPVGVGQLELGGLGEPEVGVEQQVGGHAQAAVVDLQGEAVGDPLAQHLDGGVRRREDGGVLQEFGYQVGEVGDRGAVHREPRQPAYLDPLVVLHLGDRRAHHVHQLDRLAPLPGGGRAGEDDQALGVPAHTGGQVVDPEEVGEFVGVLGAPLHGVQERQLAVQQDLAAAGEVDEHLGDSAAHVGLFDGGLDRRPAEGC